MGAKIDKRRRKSVANKVATKPKRKRSSHRGVVLVAPKPPRTAWRAKYKDPDTQRVVWESLPDSDAVTRSKWAKDKADALTERQIELRKGAPRLAGFELTEAIAGFYKGAIRSKSEGTRRVYTEATDEFLAWAETTGIVSVDDLSRVKLKKFCNAVALAKKRVPLTGQGTRGLRTESDDVRSEHTIARLIRTVKSVLSDLHEDQLLPSLTRDDVFYGLKHESAKTDRGEFLRPAQCRTLLTAALAHDAEKKKLTAKDRVAKIKVPYAPKYAPIAPFIAHVLLTGCRANEALGLQWDRVDLPEHSINLLSVDTKTRYGRSIDLSVCPSLVELLEALPNTGPFVFGGANALPRTQVEGARKRLQGGASWDWQTLRRTCGTVLTNAPAIFGAASAYRSARQLGHSVQVSERHYVGVLKTLPKDAATLEPAIGIQELMARVVAAAKKQTAA